MDLELQVFRSADPDHLGHRSSPDPGQPFGNEITCRSRSRLIHRCTHDKPYLTNLIPMILPLSSNFVLMFLSLLMLIKPLTIQIDIPPFLFQLLQVFLFYYIFSHHHA